MTKIIGNFIVQDKTYVGTIRTLHLDVNVRFVPSGLKEEKAPDFRVMVDNYELGAGWTRVSENGNNYLSVRLDDPSLSAVLNARLVAKKDNPKEFVLIWSRA